MRTKTIVESILNTVVLIGLVTTNTFADQSYAITIPSCGALVANQLNHAGGNNFSNVFGLQLPIFAYVSFWNCCGTSPTVPLTTPTNGQPSSLFTTCLFDTAPPAGPPPGVVWYDTDDNTPFPQDGITLAPGQGAFVSSGGFSDPWWPGTVYFTGTPNVPVLPATLPCGCGQWNLLSRQTNDIGTYENVTGLAPVQGAEVLRWDCGGFTTYTFAGTNWSPSAPSLNIGEAAFFLVPCPAISAQVISNTTLQLSWPADHLGWLLEAQTKNLANGLNTNWVTVPGAGSVNQIPMPINPSGGAVFYRLRSP